MSKNKSLIITFKNLKKIIQVKEKSYPQKLRYKRIYKKTK